MKCQLCNSEIILKVYASLENSHHFMCKKCSFQKILSDGHYLLKAEKTKKEKTMDEKTIELYEILKEKGKNFEISMDELKERFSSNEDVIRMHLWRLDEAGLIAIKKFVQY
jgi:hypothetical protein